MNNAFFDFRIDKRTAVVELVNTVPDPSGFMDFCVALTELCGQIRVTPDIHVLTIIDRSGSAFSFTEEIIEQTARLPDLIQRQIQVMIESLSELDRPVIAAIQGDAIGFGLEMILACDIRFATTRSRFGIPGIKNGWIPWCGGSQRLPRIVGRGKALEVLLIGEPINALDAKEMGLLYRVLPESDLVPSAMKLSDTLGEKGLLSMGYIKEAVNKGMDLTLAQGLRLEADLYYLLHTTNDRAEGIKAFQERRPPDFSGK
ncbi:enoyl-CoA hydratase/isomerase family protein [Desulfotignum balticum]|uniref:enoyl-CoA hydratase/isomerase family protein n=1 Tax=Desulfotignum balticum TaxID=115781 RepID=UPI00041667A4|nr:enoyl-CoA hydratase-related protein [Desulfotignum balticum]